MLVDAHTENVGITLYVNEGLTLNSTREQVEFICNYARKEMDLKIISHKERLWWDRFLKYCHTGE